MFYNVTLLDADGFELAYECDLSTKSEARNRARELLADPLYLDNFKVEVRDDRGVCIWDKFA
jgi:hypothetical protein